MTDSLFDARSREKHQRWRARARAEGRESYFNDLAASRRLKKQYGGTCERCGAATSSKGYKHQAYRYCRACAPLVYGPSVKPGTGPRQQQILALVQEPRRMYEIAAALGITQNNAKTILLRLLAQGFVERPSRGIYQATKR